MNTMKHSRYDSLVDLLETRARDAGDELAYGFLGQTGELEMSWTYAELQVRSAGVRRAEVTAMSAFPASGAGLGATSSASCAGRISCPSASPAHRNN